MGDHTDRHHYWKHNCLSDHQLEINSHHVVCYTFDSRQYTYIFSSMSVYFWWVCTSDFSPQLTAYETVKELKTYSTAGCIVQEVFSALRTVLSLNGGEFERRRCELHII